MRDRCSAVASGSNDRLDTRLGKGRVDGVGVIALVHDQRVDPVGQHSEQRSQALYVMGLSRRQNEAQRSALTIAAGVPLDREAASRTAKPLAAVPLQHRLPHQNVSHVAADARIRPSGTAKTA